MIGTPSENWFKKRMLEANADPRFHAECSFMDITERICEMYGQPKGIYGLYFHIFEWLADKLIWRKQQSPNQKIHLTEKRK